MKRRDSVCDTSRRLGSRRYTRSNGGEPLAIYGKLGKLRKFPIDENFGVSRSWGPASSNCNARSSSPTIMDLTRPRSLSESPPEGQGESERATRSRASDGARPVSQLGGVNEVYVRACAFVPPTYCIYIFIGGLPLCVYRYRRARPADELV